MKIGLIVLLLAALLVAMPAAAFAERADNGATALMLGTKINVQEEVGGIRAAESMTAIAVPPWALAVSTDMNGISTLQTCAIYFSHDGYESTPGAGGDGLRARFY
jgi:hypothetical protein